MVSVMEEVDKCHRSLLPLVEKEKKTLHDMKIVIQITLLLCNLFLFYTKENNGNINKVRYDK